jgi:hypothetical protein
MFMPARWPPNLHTCTDIVFFFWDLLQSPAMLAAGHQFSGGR